MERFAELGGGGSSSTFNASFLQLPLLAAASAQAIPPKAQQDRSRLALQQLPADMSSSVPTVRHNHQKGGEVVMGEISPADAETVKAEIMSHPQYPALLTAYLDCQKVGAPPDVSDRLSAVAAKVDTLQWKDQRRPQRANPELDQFMEAYCNMLVKYQEELARPILEAAEFFNSVEKQLDSITDSSTRDGAGSSDVDDDQDASCPEELDPCAEDKELKHHLLKKYGGYLGGLRQEFSKRKKKGKLPKEARQKLLQWWELHYRWPYPSETEKIALAEATGLDQKQINNWFINQRKRHWKPTSEDMPPFAMVMEGCFHAPPALYMDRPFMADGMYRLGP